jgi:hypothetical protein
MGSDTNEGIGRWAGLQVQDGTEWKWRVMGHVSVFSKAADVFLLLLGMGFVDMELLFWFSVVDIVSLVWPGMCRLSSLPSSMNRSMTADS